MDMTKKPKAKKGKTIDELTREDNLSIEARRILQDLATEFIEGCFNGKLPSVTIWRIGVDPGTLFFRVPVDLA